jgi:hypothetical protein
VVLTGSFERTDEAGSRERFRRSEKSAEEEGFLTSELEAGGGWKEGEAASWIRTSGVKRSV